MVAPGIEPGTSVLAARNSDHQITEAVMNKKHVLLFVDMATLVDAMFSPGAPFPARCNLLEKANYCVSSKY
jgi:hypothetical protein